jgi:signal transduction histidine kinase
MHTLISLSELVIKQVEAMHSYAETKKVSLDASIEENVSIKGSYDDLVRLVINLLKNAVDYNKEHGNVLIILAKTDHKAVLTIKDTGIGIATHDTSRIFERFYKADNSRTQNASGTGLGLAIVREIVDEHQGSINVSSVLDEGTTFMIEMPCV